MLAGITEAKASKVPAERREGARGAAIFMASRVVLIACGFATYAIVAHELTVAEFGVYGIVGAILNVLNTVLGTGTNQAISRLVSKHPLAASTLLGRGLRWSCLVAVLTAAGMVLAAPVIGQVLNDLSLARLLMTVALVPGLYTVNAAYSGFLNGMQALSRQGFVNMSLGVAMPVQMQSTCRSRSRDSS